MLALLSAFISIPAQGQKKGKWYFDLGKNVKIGFINTNVPATKDPRLAGMREAVEDILSAFNVPGASVAVVEKGKVLYAGGFGYKDLEHKLPVTANTLFPIGSCSKSFTAALMGTFMDEGKLDFDAPVYTYLPELQFSKPELNQQVTLRDMMTHRTGLPRHDLAWYLLGANSDRRGLLEAVRYFEVNAGLRESWQYNNYMYMAQGVLAEKLGGKSWEQLVSERLLSPLGMQATLSTPDLLQSPDHSLGYAYHAEAKTIETMDYYYFHGMEPAGSISANADAMAQWLELWVHGGQWAGKNIFSQNYYQQAVKTQMAMASSPDRPEIGAYLYGYGLGWMIKGYKGHYFVEHGGNINGFSATTGFFPADSIGIYVCVNQNEAVAQAAIRNWIADRLLGTAKTDWIKQLTPPAAEKSKEDTKDEAQAAQTQPSHALADYAGEYQNKGYGTIRFYLQGNQLKAVIGGDTAELKHDKYDIFDLNLPLGGSEEALKLRFTSSFDGAIDGFDGQFEPAIPAGIKFAKQNPKIEVATEDLKQYEGNYSLSGAKIKVYIKNNQLHLLVPGQPEYELAAYKPGEFKLTVAEGYFVRFESKNGKVVAAYLVQPDGTYKMERE